MSQSPEHGSRIHLEATQIAENYGGEHTKDQIGGMYSRLKDTLALAGITPETAPYTSSLAAGDRIRPYHFLDLPGKFYIGYTSVDDDALLIVRRVQDLESGGYTGEDFSISPKGNIEYNLVENDPRGFDYTQVLDRGFLSLRAAENDLAIIKKFNALGDQLHETINREEHRPEAIQQKIRDTFPHLMRTFRQRKNLVLPGIGRVKAFFNGRLKTNDRVIFVLEQDRFEDLYLYEDGQGFVHSDEGVSHINNKDGEFDIHDPHFMLMRVRELREALGKAA